MGFEEWVAYGVPVPVAAAIYWLHGRVQKAEARAEKAEEKATNNAQELSLYKLEAAEKFASIGYLKDVEERLVRVLTRIEGRLDALKDGK